MVAEQWTHCVQAVARNIGWTYDRKSTVCKYLVYSEFSSEDIIKCSDHVYKYMVP